MFRPDFYTVLKTAGVQSVCFPEIASNGTVVFTRLVPQDNRCLVHAILVDHHRVQRLRNARKTGEIVGYIYAGNLNAIPEYIRIRLSSQLLHDIDGDLNMRAPVPVPRREMRHPADRADREHAVR